MQLHFLRGWAAMAVIATLAVARPAHALASFATPEAASDALIGVIEKDDARGGVELFGTPWRQLLPPGEVVPEDRQAFLDKARESHKVQRDGRQALLVVGNDPWTFPVPLQQGTDGRWRFDPVGGQERLADLRVGRNESAAIQASLAYLDAQREYATVDRNHDGALEYARRLISQPGKRDGLIWSESLGDESPLGEDFLPVAPGAGYHGYRFKILERQGPHAAGGARSYLIGTRLQTGFALVAWPVSYGQSGVMSFIVNQDGVVYQKDLGPGTATRVAKLTAYDPDGSWTRVQP